MHEEATLNEIQKEWHGTVKSYVIGFVSSIFLTAISFSLAGLRLATGKGLMFTLIGLGIAQAIGQLIFFLHVGKEPKPKWETLIFLFMLMVLLIIVIGTFWIMYDLNNRVMPEMKGQVL